MLEIKKSSLQGAFGTAVKGGSLVIPIYNSKDPLLVTAGPYNNDWPTIVLIQENTMTVIQVTKSQAIQVMPYRRLDFMDIQKLGLIKFKEALASAKNIYILEKFTYASLFELAIRHGLVNFLHREYLRHCEELKAK